jgi:hypothetical protein
VFTFIWFIPNIIQLTGKGVITMSSDEVTSLTNWWVRLNWVRAVLFSAGWLAALLALSIPPKAESNI